MKLALPKGSTSVILTVFVQDSSSTAGAGLASLDQTSSIVGGYVRMGGTGVALAVDEDVTTEGTYQAPSAAGKVRIGTPANMTAGTYELHFHNDLFAAGAHYVVITLGGASNMAPLPVEVQLTGVDLNDTVHGGLTALPNAAADAAGGLPISDAGALDLDTKLANTNEVTVARMGALADWINGGRLDLLLDAIPTTAMRGTDSAALASVCTEARLAELGATNLPADIDTIKSAATEARLAELDAANLPDDVDAILADTGTAGVVVAAASKTGYALAATGLDAITATDPAGLATTFPQMVVQTWRRFFHKVTATSTQVKTYDDAGTGVLTTQTVSDDGTTETQGKAS